jgi:hypothetical protein
MPILTFTYNKFHIFSQLKNMNLKNSSRAHVICNHTLIESDFIDFWDCSPRLQNEEDLEICSNYIVGAYQFEPKITLILYLLFCVILVESWLL